MLVLFPSLFSIWFSGTTDPGYVAIGCQRSMHRRVDDQMEYGIPSSALFASLLSSFGQDVVQFKFTSRLLDAICVFTAGVISGRVQ
jgi:hypothetical protein